MKNCKHFIINEIVFPYWIYYWSSHARASINKGNCENWFQYGLPQLRITNLIVRVILLHVQIRKIQYYVIELAYCELHYIVKVFNVTTRFKKLSYFQKAYCKILVRNNFKSNLIIPNRSFFLLS